MEMLLQIQVLELEEVMGTLQEVAVVVAELEECVLEQ
jgi:hypothetical protein